MVALLRGINVGGKTTLPMATLREVAEGLGYDDVATYIQSGNLLIRTSASGSTVERDLAAAVAGLGGVQPAVIVRTRTQLQKAVDGNPFLARGADASACHLVFCAKAARPQLAGLDLPSYAPEEAAAMGKELYLFLPGGMGRSKLAADLAKDKAAVGTARSWRTVTKLLEMASAL
ncbi:MAG: DUF1697 domain-containing protein [Acidimicrobiales bacterium]